MTDWMERLSWVLTGGSIGSILVGGYYLVKALLRAKDSHKSSGTGDDAADEAEGTQGPV